VPNASQRHTLVSWISPVSALALLFAVHWFDAEVLGGRPSVIDAAPDLSPIYLLRALVIAVACGLVVWTLLRRSVAPDAVGFAQGDWQSWGALIWQGPAPQMTEWRRGNAKTLVSAGVLATGVLSLLLFFYDPVRFSNWAREDHLVESLSALFLFLASMVCVVVAWKMLQGRRHWGFIAPCLAALAAGVLFFLGGEEISWFQRLLHIKTPALLSANAQGEMNLHNLATNASEFVYYFGSFLFLVWGPLLAAASPRSWVPRAIVPFLPGPIVFAAGSVAAAFNYGLCNAAHTQIAFFGGVMALLLLWRMPPSGFGIPRWLLVATACTMVAAQSTFVAWGAALPRAWDPSEYKEMFIPIGLFLYSLDLWRRTLGSVNESSAATDRSCVRPGRDIHHRIDEGG
jgi:hypothetical protein